jgi:hypothetical protein
MLSNVTLHTKILVLNVKRNGSPLQRLLAESPRTVTPPILWLIGLDGQLTAYFRPAGSPLAAAAIGTMIEVGTLDTDCLKAWAVDSRKSDLTLPWPNRQDSEES